MRKQSRLHPGILDRVLEVMSEEGCNQREFARRAGLFPQQISRMVNKAETISLKSLDGLSRALDRLPLVFYRKDQPEQYCLEKIIGGLPAHHYVAKVLANYTTIVESNELIKVNKEGEKRSYYRPVIGPSSRLVSVEKVATRLGLSLRYMLRKSEITLTPNKILDAVVERATTLIQEYNRQLTLEQKDRHPAQIAVLIAFGDAITRLNDTLKIKYEAYLKKNVPER